jgi:hypothetical protein
MARNTVKPNIHTKKVEVIETPGNSYQCDRCGFIGVFNHLHECGNCGDTKLSEVTAKSPEPIEDED